MFSPTYSNISQNDTEILEKQQQEMQWQSYIGLSIQLRKQGGK